MAKKIDNYRMTLALHEATNEGIALGRHENQVVFVAGGVPGDVVEVEVFRKKKNYLEARLLSIVEPSVNRETPFCKHFGVCGGCKWQNMNYETQLLYKQKQVQDAFIRLGKLDVEHFQPIIGCQDTTFYRNKLEFTFSNKRWLTEEEVKSDAVIQESALGFHVSGRFDKIVDVETCYLQTEFSNRLRNTVREYAVELGMSFYDLRLQKGFLRTLMIRTALTGENMVLLILHQAMSEEEKDKEFQLLEKLSLAFPEVQSWLYAYNLKANDTWIDQELYTFKGRDFIWEEMEDLRFKVSAKSFYQTNSRQALVLYKIIRDFADIQATDVLYDLYTGTGTIAQFVGKNCKKVIGVEYVEDAITDAKINAQINGIDHAQFFAGDMKDVLNDEFVLTHGKPDVLIVDPPRSGMHGDVVAQILNMRAPKLIYVSCNASTQARDLALMQEFYTIEQVQPVDLFPHTHHVESVALLRLK